jgi:hypothetical protein
VKVFIVESSYPQDFYNEWLDGQVTRNLLNTMGIANQLKLVIDRQHFENAIKDAAQGNFDVLHLSCHGGDDGIALCDDTRLSWKEFVRIFDDHKYLPSALVMSTCCGAASGIGDEFAKITHGPWIIFGSTVPLGYSEYCVAWAILYHQLNTEGVRRSTAQTAMQKVNAVVSDKFLYRRWDEKITAYRHYPVKGVTYQIREIK